MITKTKRVLPILFNTEMVEAILDDRKTCTRRVIKPQPTKDMIHKLGFCVDGDKKDIGKFGFGSHECGGHVRYVKPPYLPGDVLYVRETWVDWSCAECEDECVADNGSGYCDAPKYLYRATHETRDKGWKPSIHMPKKAARIFLKVKDVRVERLQEITEEQTEAEGFQFTPPCLSKVSEDSYCDLDGPCTNKIKYCDMSAGELFGKVLWDSIIKKSDIDLYGWDANPWVWVIEFKRCKKPEDF